MELKSAQFGISVRLFSGSDRAYIDVTHQEYRGLRMFHLGRAIRVVDTQRDNAVMYVQVENVKACTPLKQDGQGEEIFKTFSPFEPEQFDPGIEAITQKPKVGRPKNSERKPNAGIASAPSGTVG